MRPITQFLLLSGPTSLSRAILCDVEVELAEFNAELEPELVAEVELPPEAEVEPIPDAETCPQ